MKLSDGVHTLTATSEPPGERSIRVSGGGLVVEEIGTGRTMLWDEDEGRYKAPGGYLTLSCAAPDWFCWWEPGIVDIGKVT